ncbi:hypothetical protein [Litorilituus lipolyticus]|uniref:RepB-like DNA primase domain-containing protein n=1 Tax=Litorilituus lipolyticus TaxID=2491017 RepID=A0A502L7S0_9GAMM|nr:hypothetical protein [Litorilituus lipolyticus]TPH18495.1 hypothetical protein EPA86_01655 [Litorilituus lipolyticus]
MQHNIEQVREFLRLLTGDSANPVTWQVFHDPKNEVAPPDLAKHWVATLDDSLEFLTWSQQQYCGVYVGINETDGKGRENHNVTGYRALFADFDGMAEPTWGLIPHFIQKRDDTHGHAFWLVSDITDADTFKALQKRIAIYHNTDHQVTDPARVVRIAGFNHYKNPAVPAQYAITDDNTDDDHKYTVSDIEAAFPLTAEQDAELNGWLTKRKGIQEGSGYQYDEKYVNQFTHWLINTAPIAILGSGSHTVFKVAGWGHDHGIPLETAQAIMWEHYNPRCQPVWQEHEKHNFYDTVSRAYYYANSAAGCKTAVGTFTAEQAVNPLPEPIGGWETNRNLRLKPIEVHVEEATKNLAERVMYSVKQESNIDIRLNLPIIQLMLDSCFYSSQKNSYFLLSSEGSLIEAKNNDKWLFLTKTFGSPFNIEVTSGLLRESIKHMGLSKSEGNKHLKYVLGIPADEITKHIRYFNQKNNMAMEVDMFAKQGRVEIHDEHAQIVFPHKKLLVGSYEQSVVLDYKEHFPMFTELLFWLASCRFASDRKLGYLWIHADSDFGKGFLLAVLDSFNLSVELSTKEIEKIFEGAPVGRQMTDFKRASVLVVDEFKSVKSEMKLLQNTMTISPKNQLAIKVNLYSKIFTSAEHVSSLVGDAGIEDQFANRFNYIRCKGSLTKRSLFKEIGKSKYFESIRNYFAHEVNRITEEFIVLGKEGSALKADDSLVEMHNKYGIGKQFEVLSESLPSIAQDIKDFSLLSFSSNIVRDKEKTYLKSPAKVIDYYLNTNYDQSNKPMLMKKKSEIRDLMSVDGKGFATYRVKSKGPFKAVRIA